MLFSEMAALATPQLRSQVRDLQPQLQFDDPINIQVLSFCNSTVYSIVHLSVLDTI